MIQVNLNLKKQVCEKLIYGFFAMSSYLVNSFPIIKPKKYKFYKRCILYLKWFGTVNYYLTLKILYL